jgi:poly-D-alanine transfer protein DltD
VWSRNLENEEAKARYRAVEIQPQWVVTAGKQTNNFSMAVSDTETEKRNQKLAKRTTEC